MMILAENKIYLEKISAPILRYFEQEVNGLDLKLLQIVRSKNGMINIIVTLDDKDIYLHSQYDPLNEAERMINQQGDLAKYKHVLFYGVGLGYQIEAFTKLYPDLTYSVYEPNPAIFYMMLCSKKLDQVLTSKLTQIYFETSQEQVDGFIGHFINNYFFGEVLIITHSPYAQLYSEQKSYFEKRFIDIISNKKNLMNVNNNFEKLWTFNSLLNFKHVMNTPSLFREKENIFKNKPVLLVSAGPSLEEEIEQIRRIKENGLAYIFAVGSANKALIANQIYPDAVCSYDPNVYNDMVYEEIINQKITDIPLIFGSSVGSQTLNLYPGPMLHMITNQDTFSYYLLSPNHNEMVSDAPSIAVMTIEILEKLGCTTIILVGQNFAMKNNQYYTKNVSYVLRPNLLNEIEKGALIEVEAVDGTIAQTIPDHNVSRKQMENYINKYQHVEVINTTVGGAKIAGTKFELLQAIIDSRLSERVVDKDWHIAEKTKYDFASIRSKKEILRQHYIIYIKVLADLIRMLKKIDASSVLQDKTKSLEHFDKFDKLITKFSENVYFNVLIKPMLRLQFELIQKSLMHIRNETDFINKSKLIIEHFGPFIYECQISKNDIESVLGTTVHQYLSGIFEERPKK